MVDTMRRTEEGSILPTWGVWCADHQVWVAQGPWSEREAWWVLLGTESSHPMRLEIAEVRLSEDDPEYAGEPGEVPCPKCEGDGACSQCEEECRMCDGTGYISEEEYEAYERSRRERREARDKRRRELAAQVVAL